MTEPTEPTEQPQPQPVAISAESMIQVLQQRLSQKVAEIQRLENVEMELVAICNDLRAQNKLLAEALASQASPVSQGE